MSCRPLIHPPGSRRVVANARAILAAICCAALFGCSSGPAAAPGAAESAELAAWYGQSPAKDPSGFTYQPDVVVVEGGAAAVRSVSADGLVWTLAGGTRGLRDLDVGEVMFLTSRAVGRVAAKSSDGSDVAVTLLPVQPNEVIRDGQIKVDVPIDARDIATGEVTIQEIPDLPGTVTTPTRADADLRLASLSGTAGRESGNGKLPSPAKEKLDITLDGWGVTTALDAKGLTLSVYRKQDTHLKVGADITLGFKSLRVATDIALTAGTVAANPGTLLHGVESLEVRLQAGLGGGTDSNTKVRLEVPAEVFNKPVMVGGIPMVLVGKVKAVIETALTGRNSTITASGKWGLSGPIGLQAGSPVVPSFSVINSMLDSIGGITLGPSGLVVASEFKFSLGFGVPGATAGPYTKVRFSGGVTNGSAFGAPLARCTRVDLVIKGGFGMGLNLDGKVAELISARIPGRPKFKAELESEFLWDIKSASQTIPNVPLCTGGG